MHIGFVPFYTDTINDIQWIEQPATLLNKRLRRFAPPLPKQLMTCVRCERLAPVEIHHIRPLWSYATEIILKSHPTGLKELMALSRAIVAGHFDDRAADAHQTLIPLCRPCHNIETVLCNRQWKSILSASYPLLWSIGFQRDEFNALVKQWYMDA